MDLTGWAAALTSGAAFLGAVWVIIKGLLRFYFVQQKKLDEVRKELQENILTELKQTVSQQKFVLEKHRLEIEQFNKNQESLRRELAAAMEQITKQEAAVAKNNETLGTIGKSLKEYIMRQDSKAQADAIRMTKTEQALTEVQERLEAFGKVIVKP